MLGLDTGGFQQIILKIAQEYELSYSRMSGLVTVKCISNFLCILVFGPISDRIGKKYILLCASGIFSGGCILAACTHTFLFTATAVIVIGMAFGICEGLSSAVLADAFPDQRERMLNLSQGLFSAGAVSGPLLVTAVMRGAGVDWRREFYILAVLMAVLFVLLLVVPVPGYVQAAEKAVRKENEKKAFGGIPVKIIGVLFCAMLLYSGMENGLGYFIDTFFVHQYDAAQLSTFALSGMWLAMFLSRLICASSKGKHECVVLWSLTILIFLSIGLILAKASMSAMLICVLFGAAFGPVWPMLISFSVREAPAYSGTITSWMAAGSSIGASVFPLLMGSAADLLGDIRYAAGVLLVLAISAVVVFGFYLVKRENIRV